MWEPLFLYRGMLGVFREPYLVPPHSLSSIYASGSSRHHLLGHQRAGEVTPPGGGRVGVQMVKGRRCLGGSLLSLGYLGGWVGPGFGKCHFWQVWNFPNKSFCLLVVPRPGHLNGAES